MQQAIYSLLFFLAGRLIWGWSRSVKSKIDLLRSLREECIAVQTTITNNTQTITNSTPPNAFPLIANLDTAILDSQMSRLVSLGIISSARKFQSNCRHYNKIIEWGERAAFNGNLGGQVGQRKADLNNQGSLIFNGNGRLTQTQGTSAPQPYIGHSEQYLNDIDSILKKRSTRLSWLPWLILAPLFGLHSEDDTAA